jgi:5-methylcytosine-specific restriction endonuclease McrA
MQVADLFDSSVRRKIGSRPKTGEVVSCDECKTLHYRQRKNLIRKFNPKRAHPTAGLWLCSKSCITEVERRTHISRPCLNCATIVMRRRSQMKALTFCSKECTNAYKLSEVNCCWPGCIRTMSCRVMQKEHRGKIYTAYKTKLIKKGSYTKYVVCEEHRQIAEKYLGRATRLTTGRIRMLDDPNEVYDVRGASGKFLRAVLFERAASACEDCLTVLDFFAPPKTWQVDHRVPMFRGGQTKLSNLRIVCAACHDKKSSVEKSEANSERHALTKVHRWHTHFQKDILINRLRERLAALGEPVD